jgi:hypothetical protein
VGFTGRPHLIPVRTEPACSENRAAPHMLPTKAKAVE